MTIEKRQKMVILGAGTYAEEIADLISEITGMDLVGFIEGIDPEKCKTRILGLPVYWIEEAANLSGECKAVCAVGTPRREAFIEQAARLGMQFSTAIHPTAWVSSNTTLGEGVIINAMASIGAQTHIGRHVIISRGVLVGHHVSIGDYVTAGPGANIAGRARIGSRTFIGMGSLVLDGKTVGSNSVVGAGAVVTREVPDSVQVLGVPARVTKELA